MKKFISAFVIMFMVLTVQVFPALADGPYIGFDVGFFSRRIQETNPIFIGVAAYYSYADSTRLTARFGAEFGPFDIYLLAGGANLSIPDFDGYSGKMGPLYGGGVKINFFESPSYEHFKLFFNPEAVFFSTNDIIYSYPSSGPVLEQHDIQWSEYTFKFGGSARYYVWEPYGGIKVSFVSAQETAPAFGTGDISEMDNVGFFLGANYYLDRRGKAFLYGEFGGGDSDYFNFGIRSRF